MMLRARVSSVPRNEALNPRTPVSAATPIATDKVWDAPESSSVLALIGGEGEQDEPPALQP